MVPVCSGVVSLRDDNKGDRDPEIAEECVVKDIFYAKTTKRGGGFSFGERDGGAVARGGGGSKLSVHDGRCSFTFWGKGGAKR